MKKICALVAAVLFLSIGAFAVPFGEGSVVFVISLPGPGNFRAFDFNLCCGAPVGLGFVGNGFDYKRHGWRSFQPLLYRRWNLRRWLHL